ncbi:MAG TPA: hypothetical protein VL860_04075, partial [Planctomycetota bacterium]|nr:hypothetical protein [Planctomycetota bacterium]
MTDPKPVPAVDGATTGGLPRSGAIDTHMKQGGRVANDDWTTMAPPLEDGPFLRPQDKPNAQPVWGLKEGLRVGLYPMRGPRGLLRIYAPALGLPEGKVINFIAVEPIVSGAKGRGLSELEPSPLDQNEPGLRFWSADKPDDATPRLPEDHPARGTVTKDGAVQMLTVYVFMENYKSGAKVYLRLTFRTDRPEE